MTVEVDLRPELSDDFKAIGDDATKWEVMRALAALKTSPRCGQRLWKHTKTGDLSDCRKIYIPTRGRPTHRIVYRLLPSDASPERADVIVIGAKADDSLAVYLEALARLERLAEGA